MGHQENSGVAPKPPSILPDPSHLEQFGQRTLATASLATPPPTPLSLSKPLPSPFSLAIKVALRMHGAGENLKTNDDAHQTSNSKRSSASADIRPCISQLSYSPH